MNSDTEIMILENSKITNLTDSSTSYSELDVLGTEYLTKDLREFNKLNYLMLKSFTIISLSMPDNLNELYLKDCNIDCDLVLSENLKIITILECIYKDIKFNKSLKKLNYYTSQDLNKLKLPDSIEELFIYNSTTRYIPNLPNLRRLFIKNTGITFLPYLKEHCSLNNYDSFLTFLDIIWVIVILPTNFMT